jgi:hypothetical protein
MVDRSAGKNRVRLLEMRARSSVADDACPGAYGVHGYDATALDAIAVSTGDWG